MTIPFGFAVRSDEDQPVFLPLKSVSVNANIVDVSAQVELTQVYENNHRSQSSNVAAYYIFPVPASAAIVSFTMETTDGMSVKAVVKERSKARKEFEQASREGKWTGLIEQLTGDVFVLSVGSIPLRQDIKVHISYVEELSQDELVNQVRFMLPTYIAERYGAAPEAIQAQTSAIPQTNAQLDINVNVQMASPIQKVYSPTHDIVFTTPSLVIPSSRHPSIYSSVVTFDPSSTAPVRMNKDFVLSIQAADLNKPRCVAEVDTKRNSVAMSLTLVPQFGVPQIESQEYVFVIDRSGSMRDHSRVEFAKDALKVLLKSLPSQGTFFNIVSFGSTSSFLWSCSQEYSPSSVSYALEHVPTMSADMGGTEIKSVLQRVFESRMVNIPTAVFVLTDGKVWNIPAIYDVVQGAVDRAETLGQFIRVFTLGIGDAASTDLCQGLARVGGGLCYMASKSEEISGRCSSLHMAARVPPLGNLWGLTVDWGNPSTQSVRGSDERHTTESAISMRTSSPNSTSFFDESANTNDLEDAPLSGVRLSRPVQQAPCILPDIYPLNRFIVSAILSGTTVVPDVVVLKGKVPGGSNMSLEFPVQVVPSTSLLHVLAARRLITDLQDGNISFLNMSRAEQHSSREDMIRSAVVKLSEEFQLASQYASFIAIEGRAVATTRDERIPVRQHRQQREPNVEDGDPSEYYVASDTESVRSIRSTQSFFVPIRENEMAQYPQLHPGATFTQLGIGPIHSEAASINYTPSVHSSSSGRRTREPGPFRDQYSNGPGIVSSLGETRTQGNGTRSMLLRSLDPNDTSQEAMTDGLSRLFRNASSRNNPLRRIGLNTSADSSSGIVNLGTAGGGDNSSSATTAHNVGGSGLSGNGLVRAWGRGGVGSRGGGGPPGGWGSAGGSDRPGGGWGGGGGSYGHNASSDSGVGAYGYGQQASLSGVSGAASSGAFPGSRYGYGQRKYASSTDSKGKPRIPISGGLLSGAAGLTVGGESSCYGGYGEGLDPSTMREASASRWFGIGSSASSSYTSAHPIAPYSSSMGHLGLPRVQTPTGNRPSGWGGPPSSGESSSGQLEPGAIATASLLGVPVVPDTTKAKSGTRYGARAKHFDYYPLKSGPTGKSAGYLYDRLKPDKAEVVIACIASVQSFDGSFQRTDGLLQSLADYSQRGQLSPPGVPDSIISNANAEMIWDTVLIAAFLKHRLEEKRIAWFGLWEKAKRYVLEQTGGDETLFAQLVDEAAKHV